MNLGIREASSRRRESGLSHLKKGIAHTLAPQGCFQHFRSAIESESVTTRFDTNLPVQLLGLHPRPPFSAKNKLSRARYMAKVNFRLLFAFFDFLDVPFQTLSENSGICSANGAVRLAVALIGTVLCGLEVFTSRISKKLSLSARIC
jgi:hypothetical protein